MPEQINAAIDCGAGTVKVKIGTRRKTQVFSMPSLIAIVKRDDVTEGVTDVFNPSVFSIVENNKEVFYYAGELVRQKGLQSEDVFANPELKVINSTKLILAALINGLGLSKSQALEVKAVASHHDPKNFGAAIRDSLCGTHTVRKGNNLFQITVSMPDLGVFGEGSAISDVFKEEAPSLYGVLDLGFLTSLYSLKSKDGSTIRSEKAAYGVGRLIEMLQADSDFGKLLGGIMPERDVLMASLIEACQNNGTKLFYRNRGKAIDFTAVYKRVVIDWLKGAARTTVQSVAEYKGTDFKCVAIGGGVNLPLIAATLNKFGITPYSALNENANPIFANVESLYQKHRSNLFNLEPMRVVGNDSAELYDRAEDLVIEG